MAIMFPFLSFVASGRWDLPRNLRFDASKGLAIVKYFGVVTDDDLLSCMRELREANFPQHYNELADLREVTHFEASAQILRLVANESSLFGKKSIRVILAPSSEAFGIGRMVQTYSELTSSTPFVVVHSVQEAETLLGVSLDLS
jgi:hypothetical protein